MSTMSICNTNKITTQTNTKLLTDTLEFDTAISLNQKEKMFTRK